MFYEGPSRFVCTAIDELRKLDETKNYSSANSLIDESIGLSCRMINALVGDGMNIKDIVNNIIDCSVDLKLCIINKDFSNFKSNLEKWQIEVNRLESTLEDVKAIDEYKNEKSQLKKELKKIKQQKKEITSNADTSEE